MTRADEVVAWADAGASEVLVDLTENREVPYVEAEVWASIRAAFTCGYIDALTEPNPVSLAEAMSRTTILELLAGLP